MPPRILYLHGFASSPASKKAQYFLQRIPNLEIPDLNAPEFSSVTLSRQLSILEKLAGNQPVVLMGSSLGGYLAALYAAHHANVERVVLLAPAFQFAARLEEGLGPDEMVRWTESGRRTFFHYGAEDQAELSFEFLKDARLYEPEPDVRQPCLICHGVYDDVVPVELSRAFLRGRPNVELLEFESDHQLLNVTDLIWDATRRFLNS